MDGASARHHTEYNRNNSIAIKSEEGRQATKTSNCRAMTKAKSIRCASYPLRMTNVDWNNASVLCLNNGDFHGALHYFMTAIESSRVCLESLQSDPRTIQLYDTMRKSTCETDYFRARTDGCFCCRQRKRMRFQPRPLNNTRQPSSTLFLAIEINSATNLDGNIFAQGITISCCSRSSLAGEKISRQSAHCCVARLLTPLQQPVKTKIVPFLLP